MIVFVLHIGIQCTYDTNAQTNPSLRCYKLVSLVRVSLKLTQTTQPVTLETPQEIRPAFLHTTNELYHPKNI